MLVEDNKPCATSPPMRLTTPSSSWPITRGTEEGGSTSYCALTSDNQCYPYLLLHEFGHSFAGLADEYYTSQVAYNEFYPKGIEPAEANITALLDPKKLKWRDLVTPGTPVPTPWEKEGLTGWIWPTRRSARN